MRQDGNKMDKNMDLKVFTIENKCPVELGKKYRGRTKKEFII